MCEFKVALDYVLNKYRNSSNVEKQWYLAAVIGEAIQQNRLSEFLFNSCKILERGCENV